MLPAGVMAAPTLQVGAPAGTGDAGVYADYIANTTDPTETDTAITDGNTILFAGSYGANANNKPLNIGGQFGSGGDYSSLSNTGPLGDLSVFDTHGAIAVVSIPDGELAAAAGLTLGGMGFFHSSMTLNDLFPNNHDPLKDNISDFLFYDIGDFAMNANAVPNFDDETGSDIGEIKSLALGGVGSLDWIHFDLVALVTDEQGNPNNPTIVTTFDNNPGSKDVTWKSSNGGPGGGPGVPAPAPLALLGIGGLAAAFGWRRRRNATSD